MSGEALGGLPGGSAFEILEQAALRDLDGHPLSLSRRDFAGQVLLIDFWATWCTPCELSLPFYASLIDRWSSRGFSVLAVSVDEHDDDVVNFLDQHRKLPFRIARSPDSSLPSAFEVDTMPTALLVGRDGVVAYRHRGYQESDQAELMAEIERLLSAPLPTDETSR